MQLGSSGVRPSFWLSPAPSPERGAIPPEDCRDDGIALPGARRLYPPQQAGSEGKLWCEEANAFCIQGCGCNSAEECLISLDIMRHSFPGAVWGLGSYFSPPPPPSRAPQNTRCPTTGIWRELQRHRLRMTVNGLQRETKHTERYTACPP
ncbi:hypothetical protein KIL84_004508 [Mauremys mutica]|uniref:Uncharacterized protein n=1 Tax=Mauremys mutica TaxID=74926 RepID=A0A9D4B703_9SAUR|nr:hypothetical protein KIL84_004508 [Mauremys mutica]